MFHYTAERRPQEAAGCLSEPRLQLQPDTPSSDGEEIDLAPARRGDSAGKDNPSDAPAGMFDNNDHQDAPLRRRRRTASGNILSGKLQSV